MPRARMPSRAGIRPRRGSGATSASAAAHLPACPIRLWPGSRQLFPRLDRSPRPSEPGCRAGRGACQAAPLDAAERWRHRMSGRSIRNQLAMAMEKMTTSRSSSLGQNAHPVWFCWMARYTGKWIRYTV